MTSVRLISGISYFTRNFRENRTRVSYSAGTSIKIRSVIVVMSRDISIYVYDADNNSADYQNLRAD